MSNITSKLIINSVEYEIKDALARNEVATLDSELDTEKGKITTLQTTVSAHGGRLDTAESDITTLETQVSNLDLEGSDWELKAVYTSATETLNLTDGKVE